MRITFYVAINWEPSFLKSYPKFNNSFCFFEHTVNRPIRNTTIYPLSHLMAPVP